MRFRGTTVSIIAQGYDDKSTMIVHDGYGGDILDHVKWAYITRMDEGDFDQEERLVIRDNLERLGFKWTTT